MKVNIYDFDGTVYDGDSTLDFYLYCLKKDKMIIKYLPMQGFYSLLYLTRIVNKKKWKESFYIFLRNIDNYQQMVEEFWKHNQNKMKTWYLKKDHSCDIVISASPTFLLTPIAQKLKVKMLIATEVDPKTGKFLSENCYGEEKVKRLKEKFLNNDIEIMEMYTDTFSDEPLIKIAKKGFMVDKNNIYPFYNYHASKNKKKV